jgi:chromosome segregation ATPase
MQLVAKNPQTKERLALHTNKEMSILSDTLNNMLDQFSKQQRIVEKNNQELERINKQIADKQQELAKSNQELSELNQAMIGREMKMVELKKEVELLRSRLGQQPLP